jgi:ABC-type transporter Mla MlaB component
MAEPRPTTIVCDVSTLDAPDVGTIAALARLQLVARQVGLELRLSRASTQLEELLAFTGLAEVLPLEPGGQVEERKQRVGVEEEAELDDLTP